MQSVNLHGVWQHSTLHNIHPKICSQIKTSIYDTISLLALKGQLAKKVNHSYEQRCIKRHLLNLKKCLQTLQMIPSKLLSLQTNFRQFNTITLFSPGKHLQSECPLEDLELSFYL